MDARISLNIYPRGRKSIFTSPIHQAINRAEAMEAEAMEAPPCTGGVMHMSSEDGRRLCITGLSLVDPEKARGQRVNVWAEVGQEKRAIGNLSSMEPEVAVPPVVLGGEFILRHDLAVAAAVLLHVRVLGPSASDDGEALAEAVIVLGENDEDDE